MIYARWGLVWGQMRRCYLKSGGLQYNILLLAVSRGVLYFDHRTHLPHQAEQSQAACTVMKLTTLSGVSFLVYNGITHPRQCCNLYTINLNETKSDAQQLYFLPSDNRRKRHTVSVKSFFQTTSIIVR